MMKFLAFLSLIFIGVSAAAAQHKVDKKSLDAALNTLRKKTEIPLRLPTYFPYQPLSTARDKRKRLYAQVTADYDVFEIDLCFSRTTCQGAYFYAEIYGVRLPSVPDEPLGKKVRLTDGTVGYFEKSSCCASCAPESITWDQGGVRYTVSLEVKGNVKTIIKFANSAIRNLSVNEDFDQSELFKVEVQSDEKFLKSTLSGENKLGMEADGDLNSDRLDNRTKRVSARKFFY